MIVVLRSSVTASCVAVAVLLVVGCRARGTSNAGPTAPPGGRPTSALMDLHAGLAAGIRDAIIRADLASARRRSRSLAELHEPANSASYEARIRRMQVVAAAITVSTDIVTAARSFGELTKVCASCHAQLDGPSWVDVSGKPPGSLDSSWAMPKHAWAMDQMYNGLLYNSDAPWQAGADLLANRALLADELVSSGATERKVNGLATALRDSGVRAQNTKEHDARAELFGQILGSCAGCHERTGGGPLVRSRE